MENQGPTTWLAKIPGLPSDEHYVHINGTVLVFAAVTVLSILAYLGLRSGKSSGQSKYLIPSKKVGLVGAVDFFVEVIYKMIQQTLGAKTEQHFAFIATIFVFVLFNNLLGLLPFSSAPTSSVNTTFALGIATFVYYNIYGVKEHGVLNYLKHFMMGLGPLLGVLVALLEIVSHAVRPLSLGIRLFVNMFVDHTVVLTFQSLVAYLLPVPLLLFGVVVCTIQAFVFATLTAVYVQMATEHDH